MVAPWKGYFFFEKFDRLKWHRGLIERRIPDLCANFASKDEPWYPLTSHFKHKGCPFEAGFVQNFNNEEYEKLPPHVTSNFIGKYRVSFFSYFSINGKNQTECLNFFFEIKDF